MILLAVLPLMVMPANELLWQYKNWQTLLAMDYGGSYGLSVMGWLHSWFALNVPKNWVTMAGIILFCLPLCIGILKTGSRRFSEPVFRWLFLCNILLWIVIFNHKAESPTFIIAACGIALWYFGQEMNLLNGLLIVAAFLFTVLAATDVFPASLRSQILVPYSVKVVPCIFVWVKVIYELSAAGYRPKVTLAAN
jgi:hypothetical protein